MKSSRSTSVTISAIVLIMVTTNISSLVYASTTTTHLRDLPDYHRLLFPPSPRRFFIQPPTQIGGDEIDPRYGVEKRLVPGGPNPLHN
ncbi:hypothetical protein F511_00590 [Dorcoceras hygrometricum]|nr:hypothetical protein F511_00590 [Dorcoceras hygrometricum]